MLYMDSYPKSRRAIKTPEFLGKGRPGRLIYSEDWGTARQQESFDLLNRREAIH